MELFKFGVDWDTSGFIFYSLISIIVTFIIKRGKRKGDQYDKNYFYGAFVILFVIQACRTMYVGTDSEDYVSYYNDVCSYGLNFPGAERFELFFTWYVFILSRISNNYTLLFAANAALTNFALLYFIHHFWRGNDNYTFLPLFILNYIYDMSAMRSSIAVAFALLSIVALDKREYKHCIVMTVISVFFHNSMFVHCFFITFALILKRYRNLSMKTLMIMSIVSVIVINSSILVLQQYLEDTKYAGYVDDLGSGWFGCWFVYLSFILSCIMIRRSMKGGQSISTCDIMNVFVFSLIPIYVVLGAYRIPNYYRMCRIHTYSRFVSDVERNLSDSPALNKILEWAILFFALLFFCSRMHCGLTYEFKI